MRQSTFRRARDATPPAGRQYDEAPAGAKHERKPIRLTIGYELWIDDCW